MTADPKVKTLVKILIGAAWIDGQIQQEEREYLHRVVKEKGVADEPDIQPLLYEFRPVKPEECYGWVREFLGDQPTSENCQQLIEAISGLIYSDGTVANEEARLLTSLQNLDPAHEPLDPKDSTVLKTIRNLYKRWVSSLD
ncbi:TerB family tellurite resistance protein [Leptothermofonsia sichuanensis E412]|uniref:tellurite resistance TerB family protein n=1 Tax=Leptothermofonsia sichuanensis TaxID=2917832 RepID=UPI001CA6DEED|nr:TerB family tellurite resistance protein [Leptothermofonsia sichuanensis]QZZ22200.1 TerB family tellurite resistance protein [Leptothermofonsia sichuanensis E412]